MEASIKYDFLFIFNRNPVKIPILSETPVESIRFFVGTDKKYVEIKRKEYDLFYLDETDLTKGDTLFVKTNSRPVSFDPNNEKKSMDFIGKFLNRHFPIISALRNDQQFDESVRFGAEPLSMPADQKAFYFWSGSITTMYQEQDVVSYLRPGEAIHPTKDACLHVLTKNPVKLVYTAARVRQESAAISSSVVNDRFNQYNFNNPYHSAPIEGGIFIIAT